MRTEHLQSMCKAAKDLPKLLAIHCNLIASGLLPQSFYDKFAESKLIALCKPVGVDASVTSKAAVSEPIAVSSETLSMFAGLGYQSPIVATATITTTPLLDIRPIAMGNTMRKLTSKTVQFMHKGELVEVFMPFQFGAGAPLGAECVIQIVRNLLLLHPDWTVAKVDFKNAFNTIFRKLLLDSVVKHAPGLLPWVQANHINATRLWHKCLHPDSVEHDIIWSEEGVQQGEVLGPVNFCLVIQDIIIEINALMQSKLNGGILIGYMDDLTIIAPQTSINGIWNNLIDSAAVVGLQVNEIKCQLYNKCMADILHQIELPVDVIRKFDGVVIIGTPVGDEQYEYDHWNAQLSEWKRDIIKTCNYEDTQVALMFLTKCVATKMNYFTRMTNPNSLAGKLSIEMDEALCNGLNILLNVKHVKTSDQCWLQARLSPKNGGLGIQSPVVLHAGAYLSSLVGTYKILSAQIKSLKVRNMYTYHCEIISTILEQIRVDINVHYKVVCDLSVQIDTENKLPTVQELIDGPDMKFQKKFNAVVSQTMFNTLWELSNIEDKIRLDSCSMEGSILITTIPKFEEFKIDSELYRGLLCTRLGLPVQYIVPGVCVNCQGDVDTHGRHLQSSCKDSVQIKINTHNRILDQLHRLSSVAGYRCHKECTEVYARLNLRTTGRVDLVLECFDGATPLCGDVTVTDVRCGLVTKPLKTKNRTDYLPEAAIALRDHDKNKKYDDLLNADCIFMAFSFENFGRWSDNTRKFFKKLIDKIHKQEGTPKHILAPLWKSRISMAQHKTMAIGLRNRVLDQDEDGCIVRKDESELDLLKYNACRT